MSDTRKLGSRISSDTSDLDVDDTAPNMQHPEGDTITLDDGTVIDLSKLGKGAGAFDEVDGLVTDK